MIEEDEEMEGYHINSQEVSILIYKIAEFLIQITGLGVLKQVQGLETARARGRGRGCVQVERQREPNA